MAGKFIICFIAAFALIQVMINCTTYNSTQDFNSSFLFFWIISHQPFSTLPAADNKPDVIYRNSKGEYYTSDGVILSDQYPIYWRHKNTNDAQKEHVVIVEPTITYTRQSEYSTTQTAPPTTTFRASPSEHEANFRPYYDGGRTESAAVAYYPYYIRASSSDRNDLEERKRYEEGKRVVVDATDPGYQRFIPRGGDGQSYYYYTENRPSSSSSPPPPPPPPQPTLSSKSSVRFYFREYWMFQFLKNSMNSGVPFI